MAIYGLQINFHLINYIILQIYIQIKTIKMSFIRSNKQKYIFFKEEQSFQKQMVNLKQYFFNILSSHLQQNQAGSFYIFQLCILIENLALLWYIIHPSLNIYPRVFLVDQLNSFLKYFNFHEFFANDPSIYLQITIAVGIYLFIQILFMAISIYAELNNKSGQIFKYLKKLVNAQFLLASIALSGPFLALSANVLYCDTQNVYHLNQNCYNRQYLFICAVATFIGITVIMEILIFSFIYYAKNPFNYSYMGIQNRYYIISKVILKILLPVYFALNHNFSLKVVYMFGLTLLLGGYIFGHRLFSIHSYNQKYFYLEYFFEVFLFWMSLSNIIYYYIPSGADRQQFSFVYTLISSTLVSLLILSIEYRWEDSFVKECLTQKIKKQNMQKFIYILIHRLLNYKPAQSKLLFQIYYKLLIKNYKIEIQERYDKDHTVRVCRLLLKLTDLFLRENNSIMLKSIKCFLSFKISLNIYAVHQSLELENTKMNLAEEFMHYQFRKSVKLFQNDDFNKQNRELLKFYKFHQELGIFQTYIQVCCRNNIQFWEQLCQSDSSASKLYNLASYYNVYCSKITQQYQKIEQIIPQVQYVAILYFKFLYFVGSNVHATVKMKEKLGLISGSPQRTDTMTNNQLKENQEIAIITLDTINNNLGTILNMNSKVKDLLGYEKNSLIGKNITKIMPKIYADLHNSFMIRFIRSENSEERLKSKIITALNKDNFLIQANLLVRVYRSLESDLALVGFIKSIPTQSYAGLVMYSATSGQILGINYSFTNIMNKKLTGKEVVKNEVRLGVITPDLNLQLLQQLKEQLTILQVASDLNDRREVTQKKIKVYLKRINNYEGNKIGFLQIIDLTDSRVNSKLFNCVDHKIIELMHNNKERNSRSNLKKKSDKFELKRETTKQRTEMQQKNQNLNGELSISRKLQKYIKKCENNKLAYIFKILYFICIVGSISITLFTYFSHSSYLADKRVEYQIINKTLAMPFLEGTMNTYTAKIWNPINIDFATSNYLDYEQPLIQMITLFQKTNRELAEACYSIDFPLQYNENTYHIFVYIDGAEMSYIEKNQTYDKAIISYISAINQIAQHMFDDVTPISKATIQQQALFVQQNGQSRLSVIGMQAMDKYVNYFYNNLYNQQTWMITIKSVFIGFILIYCISIMALTHYQNKVNYEIVQIFSSLPLQNVYQYIDKYSTFLEERGLSIHIKSKDANLIKSLPTIKQQATYKVQIANPLATEQTPFSTKQNQSKITFQQYPTYISNNDAQQPLLKQSNNKPTIYIQDQLSYSKIISFLAVAIMILATLLIYSYIIIQNNASQLKYYVERLKNIGSTKKTLNFIDYYAYRTSIGAFDGDLTEQLQEEIENFYKLTQVGYLYLGDPSPILKNTYTLVQTIQQWLTVQNITNDGILIANYTILHQGLQQSIKDIDTLDQLVYYPEYLQQISNGQQKQLLFTISIIIIVISILLTIHSLHLKPVESKRKQCINLLKILPPSLLQKNRKTLTIIK